ncbi:MAG: hypothetical protein FJ288_18340 [Planctomycetes bacterium]|nr:hypothetical protein [Planctomycetota bacterium]
MQRKDQPVTGQAEFLAQVLDAGPAERVADGRHLPPGAKRRSRGRRFCGRGGSRRRHGCLDRRRDRRRGRGRRRRGRRSARLRRGGRRSAGRCHRGPRGGGDNACQPPSRLHIILLALSLQRHPARRLSAAAALPVFARPQTRGGYGDPPRKGTRGRTRAGFVHPPK